MVEWFITPHLKGQTFQYTSFLHVEFFHINFLKRFLEKITCYVCRISLNTYIWRKTRKTYIPQDLWQSSFHVQGMRITLDLFLLFWLQALLEAGYWRDCELFHNPTGDSELNPFGPDRYTTFRVLLEKNVCDTWRMRWISSITIAGNYERFFPFFSCRYWKLLSKSFFKGRLRLMNSWITI